MKLKKFDLRKYEKFSGPELTCMRMGALGLFNALRSNDPVTMSTKYSSRGRMLLSVDSIINRKRHHY